MALEGVTALPSEVTIHHWLGRLGFPLVRPRVHKPLGWTNDAALPATPVWQTDFKQKRGGCYLSIVVGPHGGPCLGSEPVRGERTEVVLPVLHRLMRQRGEQPARLQTDRGPCFVGAEGGERQALPGRLTLWLWGLGITHRVLPPAKPWRIGAVERFQGAVAHSWAGEAEGLAALQAVWNYGKGAGPTA